ncbi:hypothetical protein B0H14DRAFT_2635121 [Mycena olivaceomarginata]|nr:hypothetical protein B0H14DRAFT_2635121 [Mycena olivaceomarginata]
MVVLAKKNLRADERWRIENEQGPVTRLWPAGFGRPPRQTDKNIDSRRWQHCSSKREGPPTMEGRLERDCRPVGSGGKLELPVNEDGPAWPTTVPLVDGQGGRQITGSLSKSRAANTWKAKQLYGQGER